MSKDTDNRSEFPLKLRWHDIKPLIGTCFHPGRSISQADLYELTGKAEGWILKDFSKRPLWIRLLVTRRVARREAKALRALEGIGAPKLAGFVGSDAFVMERLEADRLPHLNEAHGLDGAFFERLDALVAEMHARGWTHGDLRRKNILVDESLKPYLIDFATAIYGGRGAGFLNQILFRHLAKVDRITIAKIKKSYVPDALNVSDLELLDRQPIYLRAGRWFKKKIYRPLKRRHRQETWQRLLNWIGMGSAQSQGKQRK